MNILSAQHYIPRQDRQLVYSFLLINLNDPCKNMGKNIKSYATTQVHSPGKGREALRQKVQISHLKYGTA